MAATEDMAPRSFAASRRPWTVILEGALKSRIAPLARRDRRAGDALREAAGRAPALRRAAAGAADILSPAFRIGVAMLILLPRTRRVGLEAAVAGVAAGLSARVLRDAIGRRRPGGRADGGFPSRHAAAAVAITRAVHRRHAHLGVVLAVATAAGLTGRVATAQHEPADIAAGAALGLALERAAAAARFGR